MKTPNFRSAAAIIKHVKFCLLPEGGLHHAAAAVDTRAVVIFGGMCDPANTGYDNHINVFNGYKDSLGWRKLNKEAMKCMARITQS